MGLFGETTPTAAVAVPAEEGVGTAPRAERRVPVVVVHSTAQEVTDQLRLRGRTAAKRLVNVAAETAGRIISEPLRKGAKVTEGELLCRLAVGVRGARLAEAQAMLAEAAAEASAADQLSAKGFASETTRVARQAQLEAAAAELDAMRLDLERLEIRAPFDGILETDTAELGARLAIGDTCATVIDLSSIKVSAFVAEGDVDRLRIGQDVQVHLLNGRDYDGRIAFISRSADAETRTFEVQADLPNPDQEIRDGMTAEIAVTLPAARAHLVTQSALTLDDAGRLGVRVADNGRARFVEVAVVRETAEGLWLTGLPVEATIITLGQEFVRDGQAIELHAAPVPGLTGEVTSPAPLGTQTGDAG